MNKLEEYHINLLNFKKEFEDNIENYYLLDKINEKDNIDLSVVYTTHNRVKQTLFSLKCWNNLALQNNKNIQVIVVEDSTKEYLNKEDLFHFKQIEIILIKIIKKIWINPLVGYNIGFKYVKGKNIVITNAEVIVFGNIIDVIECSLTENSYLVFNVLNFGASHNDENKNEIVYKKVKNFSIEEIKDLQSNNQHSWLQHHKINNRCFHFLTAIKRNMLEKIGYFDMDFSMGHSYDDDILIRHIKQKCEIKNIKNDIIGLHLWHETSFSGSGNTEHVFINKFLISVKKVYFNKGNNTLYFYNNN
jgi:hypothetical protein